MICSGDKFFERLVAFDKSAGEKGEFDDDIVWSISEDEECMDDIAWVSDEGSDDESREIAVCTLKVDGQSMQLQKGLLYYYEDTWIFIHLNTICYWCVFVLVCVIQNAHKTYIFFYYCL